MQAAGCRPVAGVIQEGHFCGAAVRDPNLQPVDLACADPHLRW